MTADQIQTEVFRALRAIAPEADPAQLHAGDDLRRSLDLDSFDFLNLLIALHQKLGVEIPESDYGQLTTLGGLVSYLSAQAAPAQGGTAA